MQTKIKKTRQTFMLPGDKIIEIWTDRSNFYLLLKSQGPKFYFLKCYIEYEIYI